MKYWQLINCLRAYSLNIALIITLAALFAFVAVYSWMVFNDENHQQLRAALAAQLEG
jgi:flagellar basal body-associated protein FliL